jgi:hypothetical protein
MPTADQLLDFAENHRRYSGRVGEAVRAELGVTPVRFYVLLERALRDPDLLRRRPAEVRRQTRLMEQRRMTRARRLGAA